MKIFQETHTLNANHLNGCQFKKYYMEPKDFYFQLVIEPTLDPPAYFLITLKSYYDTEGCLQDESGIADEILPEGFGEMAESCYSFNGNPQTGREMLLGLGLIEINFGLGQGEVPTEHNDEDEEDYEDEEDEQDIDTLLEQGSPIKNSSFDYKNLSTDQLLRHRKVMVNNEDYNEAAKIQKELDSRI